MNRLQKKCLVASSGFHGFLLLILAFGSAFFVAKEKPTTVPKLQFVPSRIVEGALAGGGGNPNIARSDDVQNGETLVPQPPPPAPVQKVQPPRPQPPAPEPEPPKPEVKQPTKPEVSQNKTTPKVTEPVKPKVVEKPEAKPRIDLSELKEVVRTDTEKRKQKEEAEARERARQIAAANAQRQKAADSIGKAANSLRSGFSSGTKVDVGGPGGEAYASYGAFVQAAYEDAWTILPDLNDDDALAVIRVTISRHGAVLESRITRRSGNAIMDKSVQRAIDRVKDQGLPPFPESIKDAQRSFTIEFNLKAKRLLG